VHDARGMRDYMLKM